MRALIVMALLVPCAAFAADPPGAPKRQIIDVHMHVYAKDARWTHKVPNPATGAPLTALDEDAHRAATLAAMEKHGIVKAVVSNDLDAALRWKAAAPDRVLVSYGLGEPTDADLAAIRREHAAGRIIALGEVTAQYDGLRLDDPKLEPLFALAEELDIPVGVHTGLGAPGTPYMPCCPGFRTTIGRVSTLEEVLIRHPKLRVYVMHAGWPHLDEMKAMLYMYPQLYADVSVINWIFPREEFHEYLHGLVKAGFGKRLMFGSDQMGWADAIGIAVDNVESAPFLSEAQKRDIFHDNAARFFRFDAAK